MAEYDTTITFGGYTLYVDSITANKVTSTIKQKIGRRLIKHNVIGRDTFDWSLTVQGKIYAGSNRATDRANLESLDDVDSHALVDGVHDGNYIIEPGTLSFNDSSEDAVAYYKYTMRLIQYNQ